MSAYGLLNMNSSFPAIASANNPAVSSKPNLDELSSHWIEFLDTTPKTRETYRKGIRSFLSWMKMEGVTRPTRGDILRYKDAISARAKATTINAYLVAVRQFFRFLFSEGLYPNIADKVKGVRVSEDFRKEALTKTQAKNLLEIPDRTTEAGRRDYAILALLLTGALRTIELVRANIEDLDQVSGQTVLFVQGKGKADRTDFIVLPSETIAAIHDYLNDLPEGERSGERRPLFQSRSNQNRGGRLTTRAISGLVKTYLSLSGIQSDRITAHSLRHTAVTLALLNGQDIQQAQQFARHANITTTQIYAHNLDKAKNQCSRAVAGALFGE